MKNKVLETIKKTLYLKKTHVSEETPISEIVKDSMDLIELVSVFVNEYKISVKPRDLSKIKTVRDIIDYVEKNYGKSKISGLDSF